MFQTKLWNVYSELWQAHTKYVFYAYLGPAVHEPAYVILYIDIQVVAPERQDAT